MPVFEVRLGKDIRHVNGVLQDGVGEFLSNLRVVVVIVGVIGDIKFTELEVTHDQWGWDENIEQLKVKISIESTEKVRAECLELLDSISESIDTLLCQAGVPTRIIDDFQVVLIIGGQHVGGVYHRVDDDKPTQIGDWCDEALKLKVSKDWEGAGLAV